MKSITTGTIIMMMTVLHSLCKREAIVVSRVEVVFI